MDQWLINSETVHHGLNDVHNSHILGPTFVQMYFCILTAKQFVSFVYGVKIHALYLPKIFLRLTDWTQSSLPSHQCPPHKTQRRLISKQVFFKSCSLSFLSMTIIVSLMCKISGDVIDRLGWFFLGGERSIHIGPTWKWLEIWHPPPGEGFLGQTGRIVIFCWKIEPVCLIVSTKTHQKYLSRNEFLKGRNAPSLPSHTVTVSQPWPVVMDTCCKQLPSS